jgi:uncharacterized caspase-like protein
MFSLRRTVSVAVLVLAAGLAGPLRAEELRGVALVIGQADYESLGDLGNPLNDARAMDDMLSELGFDVTRVLDRGGERLKREIEDFLDDAEGADVAVVYYAGHAVEAGGQNYLVPIDADLSTPASAGASLVPVGELLDELARQVPVTVLLLDACRTEAFPDGSAILLPGTDIPVEIAPTGLGEIRGPTPVVANIDPESLGMVIGFASAPGEAALDGPPGTNSPYAAALLKHLGAGGYAFGDLMTMVAEEVYLKTSAQQIPWMNSSLRRVLNFEPVEDTGDEALIRDGRRKLLLSIAATPADVRRQVEAAASSADVPMDTLYGLLEAMGADAPGDPAALDQLLRTQTETLRKVMDERRALSSTDSEIVRLSDLAQRAMDEGALAVSVGFWEQAKARYAEISASLDATEAQLKARRLEGGALLARTAETYGLSGDYAASAQNFALAYAEVERWDDALAYAYKAGEADATYELGVRRGDNGALRRAVDIYGDAVRLVPAGSLEWAGLQRSIGNSRAQLGTREADDADVDAAIAAFEAALTVFDRDNQPREWAMTQARLAAAMSIRSEREPGAATLRDTILAYHAALEVLSRDEDPVEWSLAQNNLGISLRSLGEREAGTENYLAAIAAFRAALSVQSPQTAPVDWGITQNNLGATQVLLGIREDRRETLEEAVASFDAALGVVSRERVPLQWAQLQGNLGAVLMRLGESEAGTARLEQAVAAYRAALEEFTPERALLDWATATTNLGIALTHLGRRAGDRNDILAAIDTYRSVTVTLAVEQAPLQWAQAQNNLGATLNVLGEMDGNRAHFEAAREALEIALETRTRERVPLDWAMSQDNLGDVLSNLAAGEPGTGALNAAAAAYRNALLEYTQASGPARWAELQRKLGNTLSDIGMREQTGVDRFSEALEAYNAAVSVLTPETDPLGWATIANSAGWALAQAGYRLGNVETVREGRATIQSAWDTVRAQGVTDHDAYFADRLRAIDDVLASYVPPD